MNYANNLQDGPGPASQGDEGTLQCEGGFVIDGFQPLHTAAMVCGDSGQWECSDPDADPAEDPRPGGATRGSACWSPTATPCLRALIRGMV